MTAPLADEAPAAPSPPLDAPDPSAAASPETPTAAPAPPTQGPDLVEVGRLELWAMIGFFVFFGTLVGIANTSRLGTFTYLRLATKFGMFSAPPKSQPIIVRGIPRRAGLPPEVLADPNKPDPSFLVRLRDARERKWHDNVARAAGLQNNYLGYRCRLHGADFRKVQLVAVEDIDKEEKIILERNCAVPGPNSAGAAR